MQWGERGNMHRRPRDRSWAAGGLGGRPGEPGQQSQGGAYRLPKASPDARAAWGSSPARAVRTQRYAHVTEHDFCLTPRTGHDMSRRLGATGKDVSCSIFVLMRRRGVVKANLKRRGNIRRSEGPPPRDRRIDDPKRKSNAADHKASPMGADRRHDGYVLLRNSHNTRQTGRNNRRHRALRAVVYCRAGCTAPQFGRLSQCHERASACGIADPACRPCESVRGDGAVARADVPQITRG